VKKTFKKISQAFKSQTENKSDRHLHNIEKGEKIEIDGKEYVKVKLKFVDTMDFNLAKHVDNLESENIVLNKELQELKEQSEKCNFKIEQLQFCTKNVIQENNRLKEQIQKEQDQKDKTISELTKQLNDQSKTIELHNKMTNAQDNRNNELEAKNKSYQKKETTLKDKISLLEKKISKLINENDKNHEKLKTLNKKTDKMEKSDKTTENELRNNQILNKTLTDKLFNQKIEIDYLREEIKKTLTTTANNR
jgi:chromosome segregation ATPase